MTPAWRGGSGKRVKPPDILLTTPEQLALFCAWEGARRYFEDLRCVIVDEVHSIWPTKRGDLLALDLARIQTFAPGTAARGPLGDGGRSGRDPPLAGAARRAGGLVRGGGRRAPLSSRCFCRKAVLWAGHTAQHAMPEVC